MRIFLLAVTAAFVLAGCASRSTVAEAPPAPVSVGKSNRFDMTQNGRRMSADDFDRWMKARGIRIAKGAPKRAPKAQAQVQPKAQAKAAPRPQPTVAKPQPVSAKRR